MLERALYGLRQAGRQWNIHLDGILKKLGLKPTAADPCLYMSRQKGKLLLVLVYVDDILLASEDEKWTESIIKSLSNEISIKDLGKAKNCLGIEITQDQDGIKLSQCRYIMNILKRFGMEHGNPISTPADPNREKETSEIEEHEMKIERPYRQLVGALIYLAVATRPDIAHVASYLGQFNHGHTEKHWTAAKRVLRYLRGTLNYSLHFKYSQNPIIGYTDADWGGCQLDRRSYTGYVFLMCGAAISWRSSKQRTVALSSIEAEYMALSETAKEAIYLRTTMAELGLKAMTDVSILCDNRGAINLAENPVMHSRTKHIDIRHHFVRQAIKEDKLRVKHVPTADMAADIFTKALPKSKHIKCMECLGLKA